VAEIYATTLSTSLFLRPVQYSFGLEQGDDIGALSDRRQIRS
jgi:hypothetical protein